ncbi:MAG: HAD family hydrolase [Rectinemataceae bacterium]|jgi:phosphoglycolate phosphatase
MKKAVIFDLDGTLADTIVDLAGAVNRTLARRNLPEHDLGLYKLMVGDGFRTLLFRALPEALRRDEYIEAAEAEAEADYAERCLERTEAYPGVRELLATLTRRGIPFAVLSNKPDDLTKKVVAGLFPSIAFALVRGESSEFPRKPDPASVLDACARLGAEPADALYLGDSGVDMKTAKAAGITALGALWGFRSATELREAGSDALLTAPLYLLEYL